MKKILSLLTTLVGYYGALICGLWTICEFIIYLVKDLPFNWWSLWSTLICIAIMIVSHTLSILLMASTVLKTGRKATQEDYNKLLEDMGKKRNSRITPKKP